MKWQHYSVDTLLSSSLIRFYFYFYVLQCFFIVFSIKVQMPLPSFQKHSVVTLVRSFCSQSKSNLWSWGIKEHRFYLKNGNGKLLIWKNKKQICAFFRSLFFICKLTQTNSFTNFVKTWTPWPIATVLHLHKQ